MNRDGVLWSVRLTDDETRNRFDGSGLQEWSLAELGLQAGGWWPDRYLVLYVITRAALAAAE